MGPGGGGGGDDNGRTGHQRNEIISRENKKARTINDPYGDNIKAQLMKWATIQYETRQNDPMKRNRPPPLELPKRMVLWDNYNAHYSATEKQVKIETRS